MALSYGFSHKPKIVQKIKTKNRNIITKLPVPESIPFLSKMYALESKSMHGQLPVIWNKAKNFNVFDKWGNKWIDFTSTIFVANAGHGNSKIVNGVLDLLNKPLIHTYNYANEPRINYLEYLIKNTPKQFEKAYLVSAGTESTEAVMKFIRLFGEKKNRGKGIITIEGSYHGRTLGAEMAGGKKDHENWITAKDKQLYKMGYPEHHMSKKDGKDFFYFQIKKVLDKHKIDVNHLSGFFFETYQGWSARFLPLGFVQEAKRFCKENNLLLAFDEMQSGFGRTGKLFGYMHYDVEPDLICCGKGASSGFPLAFVIGKKYIMDLPPVGSMSSTNSANPICCQAGYFNFKEINDKDLIKRSYELGIYFHHLLSNLKVKHNNVLKFVEGKGLVASLIFYDDKRKPLTKLCDQIAMECFYRGLLVVHTGRESIKLAPPLTISKDALKEGVNVIKDVLRKFDG